MFHMHQINASFLQGFLYSGEYIWSCAYCFRSMSLGIFFFLCHAIKICWTHPFAHYHLRYRNMRGLATNVSPRGGCFTVLIIDFCSLIYETDNGYVFISGNCWLQNMILPLRFMSLKMDINLKLNRGWTRFKIDQIDIPIGLLTFLISRN